MVCAGVYDCTACGLIVALAEDTIFSGQHIDPDELNNVLNSDDAWGLGALPMPSSHLPATIGGTSSSHLLAPTGETGAPAGTGSSQGVQIEPSQDELDDVAHWAETEAALAHDRAIRLHEGDIEDELEESLQLDAEVQDPDEVMYEPISLGAYVLSYTEKLRQADLPANRQAVAAQILTGFTNASRDTLHKIGSFQEGEVAPRDLVYSIDIDSEMATFHATDPWPFRPTPDVQIYVVGPYDRRQVGTSKFRIDPSDRQEDNRLDWGLRVSKTGCAIVCFTQSAKVPVHHFGNTLFMVIGGKTEIYAVFPRLRDTSPGRKTSAIGVKYLEAWYDEVVLPCARSVFGDVLTRHWPLSYKHYLFKDRAMGKLLHTRYSFAATNNDAEGPAMERFFQAIHSTTENSRNETVQKLHGVRFLIQRQNDKLQMRVDNVFGQIGAEGGLYAQAVDKVFDTCFRHWRDLHIPVDTHVDMAVELTSPNKSWEPYPLLSSHPHLLCWYLKLDREVAEKTCDLNGRKSEHHTYKAHRIAGLANIAGLSYKTQREHISEVRELKVYSTGKEYTYSRRSPNRIQQPPPSAFLSENLQVSNYFENAVRTLEQASNQGQNAIRIECTLPAHRARSFNILPNKEILRRVGRVESSFVS